VELANKRRQIQSGLGHHRNTSVDVLLAEELTERCAMADSVVYSERLNEFPPRPGTLTNPIDTRQRFRLESDNTRIVFHGVVMVAKEER
jgi:hypothetical protein